MNEAAPVLTAENLGVTLTGVKGAHRVFEDISFELGARELLCMVGPSGSGKTTLLRTLAGLLAPSSGRVLFRGEEVRSPRLEVALVFQDYGRALLPWRTVEDNIALALIDMPKVERQRRVHDVLCQVGLLERARDAPRHLSGGMQQRVQIARCLAQQPRVLLMDEPFGALDAITRQALQDDVAPLPATRDTSILLVTHDLEEAIYLGDRVVVLGAEPGRIIEVVEIDLPRPRTQLATREDPRFLAYRHHLFQRLMPDGARSPGWESRGGSVLP